jgi:hypothetical protein
MRAISVSWLLLVAGCGANPEATPDQHYLGTWSFSSGTDDVSCPNGTTSEALKGNVTIQKSSDGLVVVDPEGCNFSYSLDGSDATTRNAACSFPVPELGQGVTAQVTYELITLTTSDGKTMTDSFNGKVTYAASTGNLDCIFSGSATLAKVHAE